MRVTLNGESTPQVWSSIEEADWPERARVLWPEALASLRECGYTQQVRSINYFSPRPDSPTDGFCVTLGDVYWKVSVIAITFDPNHEQEELLPSCCPSSEDPRRVAECSWTLHRRDG